MGVIIVAWKGCLKGRPFLVAIDSFQMMGGIGGVFS